MNSDSRITQLEQIIASRKNALANDSYVASLFAKGRAGIAQKLGEEATETIIASLCADKAALTGEAADLVFHLLVLLADADVDFDQVLDELERRMGVSGHAEKASRRG
jgi:phosphoribosyl-ATP pyrophosphohydrolase